MKFVNFRKFEAVVFIVFIFNVYVETYVNMSFWNNFNIKEYFHCLLYNIYVLSYEDENIACFVKFFEWRVSSVNICRITWSKVALLGFLKISYKIFKRPFQTGIYNKNACLDLLFISTRRRNKIFWNWIFAFLISQARDEMNQYVMKQYLLI